MSVLSRIFEKKHAEVEEAKSRVSIGNLQELIADAEKPRGFIQALTSSEYPVALIAEVKKASPSQGLIRPDFDARAVASAYEFAGAQALSVLTDEPHFQGSLHNLKIAKQATRLPCLRKDFIDDPYQVYEARAWGADAVLLIVAALTQSQLGELHGLARDLGMDALVEVHTPEEASRAVELRARLIGVNNRDLSDFKTDLAISERILPLIRDHATVVSESAIENHADVVRVQKAGARAVLIGTTFCAEPNIEVKVKEVMGW